VEVGWLRLAYAIAWALINDRIKLLAYKIFDPVKAAPKSDTKAERSLMLMLRLSRSPMPNLTHLRLRPSLTSPSLRPRLTHLSPTPKLTSREPEAKAKAKPETKAEPKPMQS